MRAVLQNVYVSTLSTPNHSRTCGSAANVIPNKFLFRPFHGSHSAQNLFRLRTNSESRHCSLRVLQLVVGEHAASSHAPCAGCGRWRSDRHLSLPPEATGWLFPRSNGVRRHWFVDTGGVQQAFRRAVSAPNSCCARRRGKAPASARATCRSAIKRRFRPHRLELRLTHAMLAASQAAGRGASIATPSLQIDALGIASHSPVLP